MDRNDKLSDEDKIWKQLNKQLLVCARDAQWESYGLTLFEMAEFLRKEKKYKKALKKYLEVCYIDLNGPSNMPEESEMTKELKKIVKPFDQEIAFIAPRMIHWIKQISKKLELDRKQIEKIFLDHNRRVYESLKLSISPESCWGKINRELDKL